MPDRCVHGYIFNIDRDPLGPQDRGAADGCQPPTALLDRQLAYERVRQAAYDLERGWKRSGFQPYPDPLQCAEALVARATELAAVLRRG